MTAAPAQLTLGPQGRASVAHPEIRLIQGGDVHRFLAAVAEVSQVFTRPPWAEPPHAAREIAERMADDVHRPGFALAVAVIDEQVHGFAYGVRCSRLALLASRPPGGDFTLKELAVLPRMQGRGLGAGLHDALLAASPSSSWWLATHPRG
jgi:GNAT superfamily N-acetyltransferase